MADLKSNFWQVLLSYDAYSGRLSLSVVLQVYAHHTAGYTHLTQRSRKMQSLDVHVIKIYMRKLNNTIMQTLQVTIRSELNMFKYCRVLKHIYYKAFAQEQFIALSRSSEPYSIDARRLLLRAVLARYGCAI